MDCKQLLEFANLELDEMERVANRLGKTIYEQCKEIERLNAQIKMLADGHLEQTAVYISVQETPHMKQI